MGNRCPARRKSSVRILRAQTRRSTISTNGVFRVRKVGATELLERRLSTHLRVTRSATTREPRSDAGPLSSRIRAHVTPLIAKGRPTACIGSPAMPSPPFTLEFYEDENGDQPVRRWLREELSPTLRL